MVMKLSDLLQNKLAAGNIQSSANARKLAPVMCLQSCWCGNPLDVASQLLVLNKTYSTPASLTIMLESNGKLPFCAGQVVVLSF